MQEKDLYLIEFMENLREHRILKDEVYNQREKIELIYQDIEKRIDNEELKKDFINLCNIIYDYEKELKKSYFIFGKNANEAGNTIFIENLRK